MYAAIAAGVGCLGVVWWEESKSPQPGGFTAFSMLGVMLAALFKVWVALSACVRFVDDRRSGAMELLLCTPMRPEEIIRGQWLALRRQFAGPAVVVLLLATGVLALRLTSNLATSGLTAWGSVLSHGCWMLVFVADVVALAWLGMWFGLTSRHTYGAAGKALLCIQVAPWVAYYLAMAGIMALFAAVTRAGGGTFSATFPGFSHPEYFILMWVIPCLVIAVGCTIWARRKVHREFRERVVAAPKPWRWRRKQPLPPPLPVAPMIEPSRETAPPVE